MSRYFDRIPVPNAVAKDAEASRPIFALLALIVGTDRPGRLWEVETG